MTDQISFIPTFSLEPNKLTSFNTVYKKSKYSGEWHHISKFKSYSNLKNSESDKSDNSKKLWHNMTISDNANRNLKRKINWLYYLAQEKQVITPRKTTITNFKIAFITLTLPAKQKSPTKEITNNLLNQFLTEMRGRFKMENYVWRLEFQKNGNVHYHIVTDTYIDFYIMKSCWNRVLQKENYITDYSNKMKKLSLSDYFKKYYKSDSSLFAKCKENYTKQLKENWSNPPTINVKSVISNKAISGYLSKYFAKDSKNGVIKNDLDNYKNTKNMRLWFCSRSLSKLKTISEFCEAVKYDIFALASYCSNLKIINHKYVKLYLFELGHTFGNVKNWFDAILKDYSKRQGYIPATLNVPLL